MLSAIVTILYIRSSDLIHHTTESLHHFTNLSLFHPPPTESLATAFLLYVSMSSFFFKIPHISDTYSICLSLFDLFHLA